MTAPLVSPSIFKAYDIRGVVDETLTEASAYWIGLALGVQAREQGVPAMVLGRDGRLSGPRLARALSQGLVTAGVDVLDIGCVPTPVVYFATKYLACESGVAVTGSHNPPAYNGFKIVMAGVTLYGEAIKALATAIGSDGFESRARAARPGVVRDVDVSEAYLERIVTDIRLSRPIKVAVDAGNGVAGELGPVLLKRLGCEVVPLYCEIDGHFPHHHPDPTFAENLADLIRCVQTQDCELGLAFDGDGDRLGVVTREGEIIWPDRQLMLYAQAVLDECPGAEIIYDVKCSRNVAKVIQASGGRPRMGPTGHSLAKALLKETGAALAGEMSGHFFFNDRWYGFDDGLYSAARLLEIVSRSNDASAVFATLPISVATPELQVKMAEGASFELCRRLMAKNGFVDALNIATLDGLRVEYADGFGLVRPSNTTPVLVCRFEADTSAALLRIQKQFAHAIEAVWPGLELPF